MLPGDTDAGAFETERPAVSSPGGESAASSISDEGLVHSIFRLKQGALMPRPSLCLQPCTLAMLSSDCDEYARRAAKPLPLLTSCMSAVTWL